MCARPTFRPQDAASLRAGRRHMSTLFLVLAVVAASVVAVAASARSRRILHRVAGGLIAAIVWTCRLASRAATAFLSPRGNAVPGWKVAAWIAINLLPLAVVLVADEPGVVARLPAGVPLADLGYLLVLAGLFQVLLLGAAIVATLDGYDVMEGLIPATDRHLMEGRAATVVPVVLSALILFVVYTAATAYWLAEIKGVPLLVSQPASGFAAVDYGLVALWSLPTAIVLAPIDWLLAADTRVIFGRSFAADAYVAAVSLCGWLLLLAFAATLFHAGRQLRRTVIELGEGREGEQHEIMARLRRAPLAIKNGVLAAAMTTRDPVRQKRLLEAARDVALVDFPQAFCSELESFDEEIQCFGLERALELFRQHAPEFERQTCEAIVYRCARLLERGRLPCEALKRTVRLMVAILVTKRQVVKLDERTKESMLAAVTRELKTPREHPDAAYRGLLQDLRGAVMRLKAPQPVAADAKEWVSRIAPVSPERATPPRADKAASPAAERVPVDA